MVVGYSVARAACEVFDVSGAAKVCTSSMSRWALLLPLVLVLQACNR